MKKNNFFLVLLLMSVNLNFVLATDNYKLFPYGDANSDANNLVTDGIYGDVQTAQKAIVHNDVASPWKFGTYEAATQEFIIYTTDNANWNGSEWKTLEGICPIVFDGHTFVFNSDFSPVIFFVAPKDAIYKVNTNFEYQSGDGITEGYNFFQFKANDGSLVQNMNFGGNYTPSNRTISSNFYVNLHEGDTIAFNQYFTVFGDPFCQWTKLEVLGNNEGENFTSSEANESGLYFDNYAVLTDFSYLNAKIADSEILIESNMQGSISGTYPENAIVSFRTAIDAAKNFVINNPNATQMEVNTQLATLSAAYTIFKNSFIITIAEDAANNYKLFSYSDADSDASLLVKTGVFMDIQTAQKAIVHNDVNSPWKFGTYEASTQEFLIYTTDNANWNGSEWKTLEGICPIVFDGHTFVFNTDFSPAIFFVAPKDAIYKVNTNFEYQSGDGITEGYNFFQFKANDGSSVQNMNFGGNYTPSNRNISSNFYVNLHEGDTIAFNQYFTVFGDPFCQWTKLEVLGNNAGEAFTLLEANESGSYYDYHINTALNNVKENNLKVINIENGIRFIVEKSTPVSVYNYLGMKVTDRIVNPNEVLPLAKGAYIIKYDNKVQKVLVK